MSVSECKGQKADGTACGVLPHLLDENSLCPSHRPGGREAMAERGRKGGLATKRKNANPGLDPDELPVLRSHQDAKAFLEVIARAVATGRLPDRQANSAVRAISEWIKAEAERTTAEVVGHLRDEIDRLKSEIGSRSIKAVG